MQIRRLEPFSTIHTERTTRHAVVESGIDCAVLRNFCVDFEQFLRSRCTVCRRTIHGRKAATMVNSAGNQQLFHQKAEMSDL